MRKGTSIYCKSTRNILQPILYGLLGAGGILTLVLAGYDLIEIGSFRFRTIIGVGAVLYLTLTLLVEKQQYIRMASWMLVILFAAVSGIATLYWGINTPMGIFTFSFAIVLSGVLLGSRAIIPVGLGTALLLAFVQIAHEQNIVEPNLLISTKQSDYFDIITYAFILGVFALITWAAVKHIEKILKRAVRAEETVRTQKENLALELARESTRLREAQIKEIQQLYKFAMLGQNAAATLHELSNQLSVLNLDIADLGQQNKNSKTIANAKEGIAHINFTLRQVRRQLDSYDKSKHFNGVQTVKQIAKDYLNKFSSNQVELRHTHKGKSSAQLTGDPLALMQVIAILLNNALEACQSASGPLVLIKTETTPTTFSISVIDNGGGVPPSKKSRLFSPTHSTKPGGLGVGLYIAKHLLKTQLNGDVILVNNDDPQASGAHFLVTIDTTQQNDSSLHKKP